MLLETNSYRTYLSEELARRKRVNSQYSQRAFARQLGMSPGELSELLSGKRSLSAKSGAKLAKALGLNPAETKHLFYLIHLDQAQALGVGDPSVDLHMQSRQLGLDVFHIVSDWYCFAILNLSQTEDFNWNEVWIAKRLGISPLEVKVAIERLERVGLIESRLGKRFVVQDYIVTSSGVPSEAIRIYHRQILKKALAALELQAVSERDITGITMSIDTKYLPAIKQEISDFQDQLVTKYSKGKKKEVYHYESALFKLTEGDKDVQKRK